MPGGDIYSGSCALDQNLLWRPRPGLPGHRTHVDGLWHIGASTHPGPGLGAGSGTLVAKELLRPTLAQRLRASEINTIRGVSAPPAFETLRTKLGEIHDLVKAGSLLGWDQQTMMPPRGARRRAHQLGTIGKLAHESFVSDEIGTLLDELRPYEESLDADSFEASLIRVARNDYEKSVRVPPELSARRSRARARARSTSGSRRAQKSDYELFRPWLEQLVELKHRYVECFPPADELYDTLLDDYEQGMKAAEVRVDLRPAEGGAHPAGRSRGVRGDACR